MEDIRLPESKFEFEGKEYTLRCNFNVLAEIQEVNGGQIPDIRDNTKSLKNFMLILTAMLNDYADEQGWDVKYTPKQVGRKLGFPDAHMVSKVMELFVKSAYVGKTEDSSKTEEKN